MDGLKNYREKIKNIERLVDKMENGELSIHELVELETLTRDLHERSIILKYKAFEEAGAQRQVTVAESIPVIEVIEEDVVEEIEVAPQEREQDQTPVLDFSMFDEPTIESDPIEEIIEEKEEPKPIVEMKPEPVLVREPETRVEVKTEPIAKPVAEEPMVVVKEKGSSFLDRLSILDNSISSQLAGRKIETLSGAFGINERLHYINDLFDGSGEAFSDAIKSLDSQQNLDEASAKVEEMAFKNSWNPEEEVVLEFLAIIKRRYA
ncbi:MAG: hypothetical protein COA38_01585 [Fluviicola sp.]|nr:MAG: hypothetical protein COA38_01585 [Fluviicola sp.]